MEDALWESDDAYMVESEVEEQSADCTARITARGELEGADEDDDESIATDTPDNELNKFDFTSIYGVYLGLHLMSRLSHGSFTN